MMGMLRAEMLKYKRTFMAKLVIFIPLFFAVYSLVTSYLVPGSYDWNGILVMSFNWWPVTFLPLGYGLFAGMVANLERKAGNYRVLKGEVLSPRRIWLGKIGGMALIPLQLWLATWAGMLASIVLAAVGMIVGVLLAPTRLWIFCPWSWASRLMCPTIGVHPNGIVLSAGDGLLDAGVIPVGILVSLVVFVVLSMLTALWFERRESK